MKYFSGQEPGIILKTKDLSCKKGVLGQQEIVREPFSLSEFTTKKQKNPSSLYSKESAFFTQQHWLRQCSGDRGDAGVRREALAQAEQQQMLTRLL